jgi:hypothetical protein
VSIRVHPWLNEKTFTPANGNEGIHNPARTAGRSGLILLFAEKLRKQLMVLRGWLMDLTLSRVSPSTINLQPSTNSRLTSATRPVS